MGIFILDTQYNHIDHYCDIEYDVFFLFWLYTMFHSLLADLFNSLGYEKEEGLCHGFSLRWLEAMMLGEQEINTFIERINIIQNEKDVLVDLFNQVKTSNWKNLAEQDKRKLLDIHAFFDSLALFQGPGEYAKVFDACVNQFNINLTSSLASSEAIQSLGGLESIFSEPGIYNQSELTQYLEKLGAAFESSGITETIGMLLSNHNHTIGLCYTPGEGWAFMDINQYPPEPYQFNETHLLSNKICLAFENNTHTALCMHVITTGGNQKKVSLQEVLDAVKKNFVLKNDIFAGDVSVTDLAYIAAQNGHVEVIKELAKHKADLNKATENGGATPAYVAAQNGNVEVIKELAKHKADLNKAMKNGATPACIAAYNGHFEVVQVINATQNNKSFIFNALQAISALGITAAVVALIAAATFVSGAALACISILAVAVGGISLFGLFGQYGFRGNPSDQASSTNLKSIP